MANKIKNFLLGLVLFIALLFVWKLLFALGIIHKWVLSGPEESLAAFFSLLADGTMFQLLWVSLLNIVPAFAVAIIASIVLGVAIGINETCRRVFEPFLSAVYLVPSLAWLPLIILFLGFSRPAIWTVIFISSFVRIIYNVIGGVKNVNPNWLLAAMNLELSKLEIIKKVILPGALPQILSGIRVGFGSAWRSLIGAEMLVVTAGGLGKYIWMSQWMFKFDQVIAGILMVSLVGIIAEFFVFKKIEKATLEKWGSL